MYELVYEERNDIFTDSLVIARGTDNQHESVVRLITKYLNDFEEFGKIETSDFKSGIKRGPATKIYPLNEMQAALLVTYIDNNKTVREFKVRLIKEFYSMRQALQERQTTDWLKTREHGKLIRRYETDTIKDLIPYAIGQGSKNANKHYVLYSNLVNNTAGIESGKRDKVSYKKLMLVALLEDMVTNTIREEMAKGVYYKTIYQICKRKSEQFAGLLYLSA